MSQIQFNSIPVNLGVPGWFAEFDSSRANKGVVTIPQKTLLVGQKLAAGSVVANAVVRVFSADQVSQLAGRGSMLHQMARKSFAADPFTPTFILPMADAAGSAASTRVLTLTGPSTAAGQIALHIGDRRYAVGVVSARTAIQMAADLAAAVQADADRYVDAAVDEDDEFKVNLTARNKGVDAGFIDVTLNRFDESLPAGVTLAIGALTAGTGNPLAGDLVATLGSAWYTTFVFPYTDGPNQLALKADLESRFGPIRMIDAYAFTGINLDAAASITAASDKNNPWLSLVDCFDVITPPYVTVASVAGKDSAEPDPGRPRQTLKPDGVLSKADVGRREFPERNQLINGGVSTLKIDEDGTVRIERLTTTYRTNTYGITDKAYFDTESMHLLANLRYSSRARFAQKYPRHKLGQDGSVGPNVMTPSVAKAEWVSIYKDIWMQEGWVEGGAALTQFIADLLCEIDSDEPNQLNTRLSPDLINQLRVGAAQIQFIR